MTDLIARPFMVMQLEWLLLTVAALAALVQIAGGSTRGCWIWIAAACAYGSMHATGLGLATVGATGVAFLLLRSSDYTKTRPLTRRHLAAALAIMFVLAAFHGACMSWLPNADLPVAIHQRIAIKPVLGFVWMFLISVFRSLIGANPATADSVTLLSSQWPFRAFRGLLLSPRSCSSHLFRPWGNTLSGEANGSPFCSTCFRSRPLSGCC